MKRLTISKIMSFNPCFSQMEIEELFKKYGKKKSASVLEIAQSGYNSENLLWLLLRPEIIPEKELHLLAIKFAEDALKAERKAGREPHPDSWKALKVKRQWLKNKATDEELTAAGAASWAAARAAARDAAGPAAWDAAWDDAWKEQLKQVIKVLNEIILEIDHD